MGEYSKARYPPAADQDLMDGEEAREKGPRGAWKRGGGVGGRKLHVQRVIGRLRLWRRGRGVGNWGERVGGGRHTPPHPDASAQYSGPTPGGKRGRCWDIGRGKEHWNTRGRGDEGMLPGWEILKGLFLGDIYGFKIL